MNKEKKVRVICSEDPDTTEREMSINRRNVNPDAVKLPINKYGRSESCLLISHETDLFFF